MSCDSQRASYKSCEIRVFRRHQIGSVHCKRKPEINARLQEIAGNVSCARNLPEMRNRPAAFDEVTAQLARVQSSQRFASAPRFAVAPKTWELNSQPLGRPSYPHIRVLCNQGIS